MVCALPLRDAIVNNNIRDRTDGVLLRAREPRTGARSRALRLDRLVGGAGHGPSGAPGQPDRKPGRPLDHPGPAPGPRAYPARGCWSVIGCSYKILHFPNLRPCTALSSRGALPPVTHPGPNRCADKHRPRELPGRAKAGVARTEG